MPTDRDHVTFDGELRGRSSSGEAIKFYIEVADEDVWLPVSQIELSDDETSVLVPRWLAEKKGLI